MTPCTDGIVGKPRRHYDAWARWELAEQRRELERWRQEMRAELDAERTQEPQS